MKRARKESSSFKAGMFLLDSFTSGMYNDPLIIYREYIQNAVDSIDLTESRTAIPLEVLILLNPMARQVTISDNAMGVPSALAGEVLSSVGSSNKAKSGLRGFRGIGRLGGIAFCDRAVFRTKAKNEAVESIQEWDCQSLRQLLANERQEALTIEEVFERVTSFRQEPCADTQESYFEVSLSGVTSFRNHIFDLEKVRRYLSQVAPAPFSYEALSYAPLIDEFLSAKLPEYGRYNILLNGEPVQKPYKDRVRVAKGDFDHIDGVTFFELQSGREQPIAFGWYGVRRGLLGGIARGDDSSGMRVRAGNIQIGDAHLLDFCFREPRFNGYVAGEVHVTSPDLIPNSRRDDFVDNAKKGLFYNLIEREVGLPLSKEIRLRSRLASQQPSVPVPHDSSQEPASHSTEHLPDDTLRGSGGDDDKPPVEACPPGNIQGEPSLSVPHTVSADPSKRSLPVALKKLCGQCPKLETVARYLSESADDQCDCATAVSE